MDPEQEEKRNVPTLEVIPRLEIFAVFQIELLPEETTSLRHLSDVSEVSFTNEMPCFLKSVPIFKKNLYALLVVKNSFISLQFPIWPHRKLWLKLQRVVSILVTCLKVGQVNYSFQDCRKTNSTSCYYIVHQANNNLKALPIPIKAESVHCRSFY